MKKLFLFKLVTAVLLAAVCLFSCKTKESFSLSVHGYPVERAEYAVAASNYLPQVAEEFREEYSVNTEEASFWEQSFNGKTPMDRVMDYANERIVEAKGYQICALELGLVSDIRFSALKKELKTGVSIGAAYEEWQEQLEQSLLHYVETEIVETDQEGVRQYYQMLSSQDGEEFEAGLIFCVWENGSEAEKEELRSDLMQLGYRDGWSQEAVDAAGNETGTKITRKEVTVSSSRARESLEYRAVTGLVRSLEDGNICEWESLDGSLTGMIQVVHKENLPFGSFEETKNDVEERYRNALAKEYLEKRISEMSMETGEKQNRLTYQDIVDLFQ